MIGQYKNEKVIQYNHDTVSCMLTYTGISWLKRKLQPYTLNLLFKLIINPSLSKSLFKPVIMNKIFIPLLISIVTT